jgi:crotonobetainyl-CoA:carnitine CoA-transferase CaiB-like acyl-CoA transferase
MESRMASYSVVVLTADGSAISFTEFDDALWAQFAISIGALSLLQNNAFRNLPSRRANHGQLYAALEEIFSQCTLREWRDVIDIDQMAAVHKHSRPDVRSGDEQNLELQWMRTSSTSPTARSALY